MEAIRLNPNSAAKRAGLNPSFIRDILRGRTLQPSAERLALLAEALECSVGYLLGRDEPKASQSLFYEKEAEVWRAPEPLSRPERPAGSLTMLPVRFELITGRFERRVDLEKDLGSEPGTTVPAYSDRRQWYEVVRDGSVDLVAPEGSLLQVADYSDSERDQLGEGDVVIIERHLVGPKAAYYTIERSARLIHRRYPDLGLWFFEFPTSDEEYWGISDDIFRDERAAPGQKDQLDREFLESIEEALASSRSLPPPTREQTEVAFDNLTQMRKLRPRIVGKVLRAVVPVDPTAAFGYLPNPT
jgi:transcriptional regulator with XRE-family HTH domain